MGNKAQPRNARHTQGILGRLVGLAILGHCAYWLAKDSTRPVWYQLCWCVGFGFAAFLFGMMPHDNYTGGDGLTDRGEYVDTTEASPPHQAAINGAWAAFCCADVAPQ